MEGKLVEVEIDPAKPYENWFIFRDRIVSNCKNSIVLVDITTMTREAIWLTLYNCRLVSSETHFIYFRPQGYTTEWISRDPGKPRLLYKMSGIAQLGLPTLLIVTGGYDIQRLDSLIYNFEPKTTILYFQDSENERNRDIVEKCQELFKSKYNVRLIYKYNPYDIQKSYNQIVEKLSEIEIGTNGTYFDNYNIILNSLGAKTSALTLFKLWLNYPQLALSYIPSKEYNKEYSYGTGEAYFGKVEE
ncbi:hypothetical protein [Terrimonas sp.]|uniref:hypothetical protein n=1 Tax=Terrimonas sp. TaxID=1914338 RepID=UPI001057035D|nr:hypothetical protein [Terrimonas sp.]